MSATLDWATPDIDSRIAYMARVSNPNAKPDDPYEKLIEYLLDHKHFSPFEMCNICINIETTRDIGRQLLRHRSLHFQEFSQRYSEIPHDPIYAEARLQDHKNRQNSILTDDLLLQKTWAGIQKASWECDLDRYKEALKLGIAKELARKLLPEGLTKTHMFVSGTVRDWFHYLCVRTGPETQLEHRELANEILKICLEVAPATFGRIEA